MKIKKYLYLLFLFLIFALIACQQEGQKEIELYNESFIKDSENWRVTIDIKDLGKNSEDREETRLELTYLKDLSKQGIDVEYRINLPNFLIVESPRHVLSNEERVEDYYYDYGFARTLTYGSIMVEVKWKDENNLEQIEYFNFPEEIELSLEDIEEMTKNLLKNERENVATLIRLESNDTGAGEDETEDIIFYLSFEDDRIAETGLSLLEDESDYILLLFRKYPDIKKVTFYWQIPQIESDTYLAKLVAEKELGEFQYITEDFDPRLISD